MDSADTADDSRRNLMHKKNDKICIGENSKVTQHDPELENANDKEHPEAHHFPIIAVNVVKTMLVFTRANIYSKVIPGLDLDLHFPH